MGFIYFYIIVLVLVAIYFTMISSQQMETSAQSDSYQFAENSNDNLQSEEIILSENTENNYLI